jgi:thiosulfate/3-mercaptopyruvate sulfurtransferase
MARTIDPIVSTEWLADRLQLRAKPGLAEPSPTAQDAAAGVGGAALGRDLTVIDIRFAEEYEAGHIPGAISVPFGLVSAWADSGDLILELPPEEQLFETIGDCGLTPDSTVVIVGRVEETPAPPYPLADAVRVAATLIYAGVTDVAVLAGGHAKWAREGRPETTERPQITPRPYSGTVDRATWVSTDYVKDHMGRAVILDSRDPDQYFGASIDPFADMRGHVPSARSLPLIWVWEPDGTYRPAEFIERMAAGVLGEDRQQEIICYCGVGGYASTWWFLLTQLFGYTDVKIYDGSMEAWVEEKNPLVQYRWD